MQRDLAVCLALGLILIFAWAGSITARSGNPEKGKRVYDQYCVPCHGKEGKGNGTRVTVEKLDPRPRNHTDGDYMNKRTNVELFKVDKGGGFSMNLSHQMPSWGHILTEEEIWDVVAYLRTLAVPPYKPQGGGAQSQNR